MHTPTEPPSTKQMITNMIQFAGLVHTTDQAANKRHRKPDFMQHLEAGYNEPLPCTDPSFLLCSHNGQLHIIFGLSTVTFSKADWCDKVVGFVGNNHPATATATESLPPCVVLPLEQIRAWGMPRTQVKKVAKVKEVTAKAKEESATTLIDSEGTQKGNSVIPIIKLAGPLLTQALLAHDPHHKPFKFMNEKRDVGDENVKHAG